jgi:hypothetical protein
VIHHDPRNAPVVAALHIDATGHGGSSRSILRRTARSAKPARAGAGTGNPENTLQRHA